MHFTTRNTTPKTNNTNEYSLISMYCVLHQLLIAKLAAMTKEWSTSPLYTYDGDNSYVWRHCLPPLMTMTTATMTRCHADRMMMNTVVYDVVDKRCYTTYHYEANLPFATFGHNDAVDLSVKAYKNYRYGFNGMEKDDEVKGSGNSYDFGARMYDSRLGRWLSLDPKFQIYVNLNPYHFTGNNPIRFIDTKGDVIVVPNKADRKAVLKMINSKAVGLYAFNSKGELYQVKATGDNTKYSQYYADKLVEGINSTKTIEIRITETRGTPTTSENKSVHQDGTTEDIDKLGGGGMTTYISGGGGDNALVYISGNENTTLKDESGKALEDKPADILAHELVGHAIPYIVGTDTGNAVENENKVRTQVKKEGQVGPSPLRAAESSHGECGSGGCNHISTGTSSETKEEDN
jgi:RHS repeat-associated protein